MELFGSYTSPFVRHCRIALLETKTKFSFTETDFETSAKLSPAKRFPFFTTMICACTTLPAFSNTCGTRRMSASLPM